MNIIDLILSLFLLLGLIRGLFRGFFSELAGLVALLVGIYVAIHFSSLTFGLLSSLLSWEEKYLAVLAFAITFFVAALLVSLGARFLTTLVKLAALGLVNRLLGGIIGLLKMAFLASIIFMFFDRFGIFQATEQVREDSVLYDPVRQIAPAVLPTIILTVKNGEFFETPEDPASETKSEADTLRPAESHY